MPRPSFLPISHALLCAAAAWPCCAAADLSAAVDTAAAAEPHIYCGVPAASAGAALSLAELVAAGMKQNSDTRVAWAQAEEAALNLGVVRSKYGPILAAQAAALHEHAAFPLPKTLNPNGYFKSDAEALVPAVTLKWLLYDGGREAVLDRAGQQLAGANFGFSAAHRRVAIQITQQFFRLSAQTGRQMAAADSLQSALMVEQLAQARQRRGLATAPEALQAGAQAAEARLQLE
ncbi:TolC family protein, partial [Duganella alba]